MPERTYVFDGNDNGCCGNNAAVLASLMGRNNQDPMALAAMMNGGMNSQWNNPFIYLVWMMFANRFFGNGWGGESGCNNPQIEALREQMNTNQNSGLLMDAIKGNNTAINQLAGQLNCDFSTLDSAICDVRGGIDRLAGQVGFSAERVINAVQAGDCNLASRLQECCCENRLAICNQTNTLQNGQRDLGVSITKGFCDSAYATREQTGQILNAITAQSTFIADKFCALEMREMQRENQNLRDQVSQYRDSALAQQTATNVVQRINPAPIPAYFVPNVNGCSCNNFGYPYNGNGGCCGNSGCGC